MNRIMYDKIRLAFPQQFRYVIPLSRQPDIVLIGEENIFSAALFNCQRKICCHAGLMVDVDFHPRITLLKLMKNLQRVIFTFLISNYNLILRFQLNQDGLQLFFQILCTIVHRQRYGHYFSHCCKILQFYISNLGLYHTRLPFSMKSAFFNRLLRSYLFYSDGVQLSSGGIKIQTVGQNCVPVNLALPIQLKQAGIHCTHSLSSTSLNCRIDLMGFALTN